VDHDVIRAIHYSQWRRTDEQHDAIVSFSSIEHSGLGRYGDPVDPDGDIKALQDIHSHLKGDGYLLLGIPEPDDGIDRVCLNLHRSYGRVLLKRLLDVGFEEIDEIRSPSPDTTRQNLKIWKKS